MIIGFTTVSGTQTGMLWLMNSGTVSGSATIQSLVPPAYGKEVSNIVPYAISNTNSGSSASIICNASVLERTGTGTSVATGTVSETLVFNVPANNPTPQTTGIFIAKAPSGITFSTMFRGINQYGVIAAIGDPQSTGTKHALLLLPAQVWTKSAPDVEYGKAGWNDKSRILISWNIQTFVIVPPLGGLQIKLGVMQDYKGTMTVTYEDGGSTSLPIPDYIPDFPPEGTQPFLSSTNSQGYVTGTFTDYPQLPVGIHPARILFNINRSAFARDFVTIQIGSNNPVIVAETDWSFNIQSPFLFGSFYARLDKPKPKN